MRTVWSSMRETAPQEVHSRRANYRGQIGETWCLVTPYSPIATLAGH